MGSLVKCHMLCEERKGVQEHHAPLLSGALMWSS